MDSMLLRPEEAAQILGLGRSKLFELLSTGELASVRIGKARRIPRDEIERFVESLRASA